MDAREYVEKIASAARRAAAALALSSGGQREKALLACAALIRRRSGEILAANEKDLARREEFRLSEALVDRLRLTDQRIGAMAEALEQIARQADPVGQTLAAYNRPDGLRIEKRRVPIGVIGIIYESRPNVTADAAALCLKAGNACILRGGKEAFHSNVTLARILAEAGVAAGLPEHAVQLVEVTDRETVTLLAQAEGLIDVIIPRGGEGLIKAVVEAARVPVIKHYKGVCHTYVDAHADLAMAQTICYNAKVQRPGVCNAMETLLVHSAVAQKFIPPMFAEYRKAGVELRGCERTRKIDPMVKPATEEDWYAEYLDKILAVRIVESLDEAINHIRRYGSAHTDAIVTDDVRSAERFVREVDSSSVMVNASTRFSDGGEYGLGAEIGISTDKLHARGPMGAAELTTYKWIVYGNGTIRQ